MKALIFCNGEGGDFHDPVKISELFRDRLVAKGLDVELALDMDCLGDADHLKSMDLIIPNWSLGQMDGGHWENLSAAVSAGTGFGGVHGGAGASFRANLSYQWMVGGQFVGHPFTGEYEVKLTQEESAITAGMDRSFPYKSEQYFMLVDPTVRVLAETDYANDDMHAQATGTVLPVVWTKTWGKGRVFYSALGHSAQEFVDYPHVLDMTMRGLLWATGQDM